MNKIFYIVFGLIAVASIAGLSTEFVNFDVQDYQFFGSFAEFDEAVCTCEGNDGTVSKENCQQFGADMSFTDLNGVCVLHPAVDIGDYGVLPTLDQGCGVGFWKSNADESQVLSIWPAGYNPDDYYNDMFKTTIVSENKNKDKGGDKKVVDKVSDEDKGKGGDKVSDEDKIVGIDSEDDDTDKGGDKKVVDKVSDEDKGKDGDKVSDEDKIVGIDSEDDDTDNVLTLLEALNAKGGKMGHLLRASVAALLNSAHSEVSYQYPVQEVISMTQDAMNSENYNDAIDIFEELNEEGVLPPLCEDFDENSSPSKFPSKNPSKLGKEK